MRSLKMNAKSFKTALDHNYAARLDVTDEVCQEQKFQIQKSKLPALTLLRKQKIQFFAGQALNNPFLGYGSPGSDSWILGIVQFLNCPTVTQDVVKVWLEKDASLLQARSPVSCAINTRTKTLTPIKPSSRHQDALRTIKKASTRSTHVTKVPASWHNFFRKSSEQTQENQESTASGISVSTLSPSLNDAATADVSSVNCGQNSPAEEINQMIGDLNLGNSFFHFDLLRASIDENNHELSMRVIKDLENLYNYIMNQLQYIVTVADTNPNSVPNRNHGGN